MVLARVSIQLYAEYPKFPTRAVVDHFKKYRTIAVEVRICVYLKR